MSDYWKVMCFILGAAVKEDWQESATGGFSFQRYIRDNIDILSLFAQRADLLHILATDPNWGLCTQQIQACCQALAALHSMLAHPLQQVSRHIWREDVHKKIADLEHCDFSKDSVGSFKQAMILSADAVSKADKKKDCKYKYKCK